MPGDPSKDRNRSIKAAIIISGIVIVLYLAYLFFGETLMNN